MRWLVRLTVLALAVGAVREMRDRQHAVLAVGTQLEAQRRDLKSTEADLDVVDASIDDAASEIARLAARIDAMEREHPGGIPETLRPEYLRLVKEHNDAVNEHNALVARRGRMQVDYAAQVDRHNARVAEANAYAAASGPCSFLPAWVRERLCD